MRLAPIRYCGQLRNASRDGLNLTLSRGLPASAPAQVLKLVQRFKSDKKASNIECCKEPDQAADKRVDCWPTNRELQPPPNYDPYHIKVPKVAVPALPPSDAKRAAVLSTSGERGGYQRGYPPGAEQHMQSQHYPSHQQHEGGGDEHQQHKQGGVAGWLSKWKKFFRRGNKDSSDSFAERSQAVDFPKSWEGHFDLGSMNLGSMFHIAPVVHPDNKQAAERSLPRYVQEVLPPLGYHGRVQYKYAFHEPWKPLDRLTLLAEAEPCLDRAAGPGREALAPLEDKSSPADQHQPCNHTAS